MSKLLQTISSFVRSEPQVERPHSWQIGWETSDCSVCGKQVREGLGFHCRGCDRCIHGSCRAHAPSCVSHIHVHSTTKSHASMAELEFAGHMMRQKLPGAVRTNSGLAALNEGGVTALITIKNLVISGHVDGAIFIWEMHDDEDAATSCSVPLVAHSEAITSFASNGNKLYSASRDGAVRSWNIFHLVSDAVNRERRSDAMALCIVQDMVIASAMDGSIRVLDGNTLGTLSEQHVEVPVTAMLEIEGMYMIAGHANGALSVWEFSDDALKHVITHDNTSMGWVWAIKKYHTSLLIAAEVDAFHAVEVMETGEVHEPFYKMVIEAAGLKSSEWVVDVCEWGNCMAAATTDGTVHFFLNDRHITRLHARNDALLGRLATGDHRLFLGNTIGGVDVYKFGATRRVQEKMEDLGMSSLTDSFLDRNTDVISGLNALEREWEAPVRARVVVVGNPNAGKSSVLKNLDAQCARCRPYALAEHHTLLGTVESSLGEKDVLINFIEFNRPLSHCAFVNGVMVEGNGLAIVCFSLTGCYSETTNEVMQHIAALKGAEPRLHIMLVGTHLDLVRRVDRKEHLSRLDSCFRHAIAMWSNDSGIDVELVEDREARLAMYTCGAGNEGVEHLSQSLFQFISDREVQFCVPGKWAALVREICRARTSWRNRLRRGKLSVLGQKFDLPLISLAQFEEVAGNFGVTGAAVTDCGRHLWYTGEIVMFNIATRDETRVCLDTQWILDALGLVMRKIGGLAERLKGVMSQKELHDAFQHSALGNGAVDQNEIITVMQLIHSHQICVAQPCDNDTQYVFPYHYPKGAVASALIAAHSQRSVQLVQELLFEGPVEYLFRSIMVELLAGSLGQGTARVVYPKVSSYSATAISLELSDAVGYLTWQTHGLRHAGAMIRLNVASQNAPEAAMLMERVFFIIMFLFGCRAPGIVLNQKFKVMHHGTRRTHGKLMQSDVFSRSEFLSAMVSGENGSLPDSVVELWSELFIPYIGSASVSMPKQGSVLVVEGVQYTLEERLWSSVRLGDTWKVSCVVNGKKEIRLLHAVSYDPQKVVTSVVPRVPRDPCLYTELYRNIDSEYVVPLEGFSHRPRYLVYTAPSVQTLADLLRRPEPFKGNVQTQPLELALCIFRGLACLYHRTTPLPHMHLHAGNVLIEHRNAELHACLLGAANGAYPVDPLLALQNIQECAAFDFRLAVGLLRFVQREAHLFTHPLDDVIQFCSAQTSFPPISVFHSVQLYINTLLSNIERDAKLSTAIMPLDPEHEQLLQCCKADDFSSLMSLVGTKSLDLRGAPHVVTAVEDAMIRALKRDDGEEIVRQLVYSGISAWKVSRGMTKILVAAVKECNTDLARWAIDGGADLNVRDNDSCPLHIVTASGHNDLAELLLEKGAVVDSRDGKGRTALFIAVKRGFDHCTALLLEHGADASFKLSSGGGMSALDAAARATNGNPEACIQLLLTHGATTTSLSPPGSAPFKAVKQGVVNVLLKCYVDSTCGGRVEWVAAKLQKFFSSCPLAEVHPVQKMFWRAVSRPKVRQQLYPFAHAVHVKLDKLVLFEQDRIVSVGTAQVDHFTMSNSSKMPVLVRAFVHSDPRFACKVSPSEFRLKSGHKQKVEVSLEVHSSKMTVTNLVIIYEVTVPTSHKHSTQWPGGAWYGFQVMRVFSTLTVNLHEVVE